MEKLAISILFAIITLCCRGSPLMQGPVYKDALSPGKSWKTRSYGYYSMYGEGKGVRNYVVVNQHVEFSKLSAKEYRIRAISVYGRRIAKWSHGQGVGKYCMLESQRCSIDLLCVGPEHRKKCVKPAPQGGKCDAEYKVCDEDLTCQRGRCEKPALENEYCSNGIAYVGKYPQCAEGLYCREKRCRRKRGENEYCSPSYLCKKGLVCDYGKCRTERGNGYMKDCGGGFGECKRGLLCAAIKPYDVRKRCSIIQQKAKACGSGCLIGEECNSDKCWRVLPKGSVCYGAKYELCGYGTMCSRHSKSYWNCEESSRCDKASTNCTKTAGEGEKCTIRVSKSGKYPVCAEGLHCHASRCSARRSENEFCSSRYPCRKGLECDYGKCRTESGNGYLKACGGHHGECKRGLLCAVISPYDWITRCGVPRERKRTCGSKNECPFGYMCRNGVCWNVLLKDERCYYAKYAVCEDGFKCVRNSRHYWTCQ